MRSLITFSLIAIFAGTAKCQEDSSFAILLRKYIQTDTGFIATRLSMDYKRMDKNGVVYDCWNSNNIWTVCNYKKVDSGTQCIYHSDNELYVFQDRRLIRAYYSKCKIFRKWN